MKAVTDWSQVPLFMDLETAAEVMGISRTTAWRWAKAGALPAIKVGRSWRVSRASLMAFAGEPKGNAPAAHEGVTEHVIAGSHDGGAA